MPRTCYHCPRSGTGKFGFSFVRITSLLVSCRLDSAQCQNHAFILNAALMLSMSTCGDRQAWFLFCPHHGADGLLLAGQCAMPKSCFYAQCRAHVIIVHVQGQECLVVSLLSASRRCWSPACWTAWRWSAQSQNHAFMPNAALMLSLSTCRDWQAWFLFCPHHGAAGLLSVGQLAMPESCYYMINAALMLSLSMCRDRHAWFVFCPHHGVGLLPAGQRAKSESCSYAQCRDHASIVHVQGQASLVSLLSTSRRCWSSARRTVRNARIMFLFSMPHSLYYCPRAGTGKLGTSFVRITALLVSCLPNSVQYQNHAFICWMPRSWYHFPTCRDRKAWFLFCPHHGAVSRLPTEQRAIPESCFYMLNAAFMLSLSTCKDRHAWFLFCPHHGAAGLLPAGQCAMPESCFYIAQCRTHVIIVHMQGQASLVSLLSASRRCWSPALVSGWGQATVS